MAIEWAAELPVTEELAGDHHELHSKLKTFVGQCMKDIRAQGLVPASDHYRLTLLDVEGSEVRGLEQRLTRRIKFVMQVKQKQKTATRLRTVRG